MEGEKDMLHIINSPSNVITVKVKEAGEGRSLEHVGELRTVPYKRVVEKHDRKRLLRILGLDERIFNNLKEILREGVTMWIVFNWLRRKSSGVSLSTRG